MMFALRRLPDCRGRKYCAERKRLAVGGADGLLAITVAKWSETGAECAKSAAALLSAPRQLIGLLFLFVLFQFATRPTQGASTSAGQLAAMGPAAAIGH